MKLITNTNLAITLVGPFSQADSLQLGQGLVLFGGQAVGGVKQVN